MAQPQKSEITSWICFKTLQQKKKKKERKENLPNHQIKKTDGQDLLYLLIHERIPNKHFYTIQVDKVAAWNLR